MSSSQVPAGDPPVARGDPNRDLLHVWAAPKSAPPTIRRSVALACEASPHRVGLQFPFAAVGMTSGEVHVHDVRTGARVAVLAFPEEESSPEALASVDDPCAWMVLWGDTWQLFALYGVALIAEWRAEIGDSGILRFVLHRMHDLRSHYDAAAHMNEDVYVILPSKTMYIHSLFLLSLVITMSLILDLVISTRD